MSDQLKAHQREIGAPDDGGFGPVTFKAGMAHFGWTVAEAAIFYGNVANETGGFTVFTENLSYSADALLHQWPTHFPTLEIANAYAHQPVKIANRAYANRMGNGDEASGDGWKWRGRSGIQTTFHDNYLATAKYLNRMDIMDNPDLLAGELAMDGARAFFAINHLWEKCTDLSTYTVTNLRSILNRGHPWEPGTPTSGIIGLSNVMTLVNHYATWA